MTLSSTPCSCGGNNPNCFRCWGTGMVEPATRPDTGPRGTDFKTGIKKGKSKGHKVPVTSTTSFKSFTRVIHIQPTASFKPIDASLTCPECGAKISSKAGRLEKHLKKVHGPDKVALPLSQGKHDLSVSSGTRPPELHVCPECGVLVKSLEKHAKRTGHGPNATLFDKAVQRSKGRLKRSPPITVKCPHCRAKFPNSTQLASHVAGSHGKRAFQNLDYQARSTSLKTPDANPPRTVIERSSNMDAKHGWGGSFRDNGQFGSYPSHDGMDDESFS